MFNIFLKIFIKKFGGLKNSATFTSSNKNQNQMTTKNPDGSVTRNEVAMTAEQAEAQLEACTQALINNLSDGGYMSGKTLAIKLDTLIRCAKIHQMCVDRDRAVLLVDSVKPEYDHTDFSNDSLFERLGNITRP